MGSFRTVTACGLAIFLLPLATHAQERPRIGYVYPAGGRQGTTFQVTLGGRHLNDIHRIHFSGAGVAAAVVPNIKFFLTEQEIKALRQRIDQLSRGKPDDAALLEIARLNRKIARHLIASMRRATLPALAETVVLQVRLAADAEPGMREMRLESPRGLSEPFRFFVGTLPEFFEQEPELVPELKEIRGVIRYPGTVTTDVTLPAVANGQIVPREPDALFYSQHFTPGDADRFRFQARKGQQVVVAASARELVPYLADAVPGWFQATLAVFDARGNEVAYADDYRFNPDPLIVFTVPEDGQYTVEIKDAIHRGRVDFVYRITMGELPFITGIFPLGGRAGAQTSVRLSGCNLSADTLTMDARDKGPGVYSVLARKANLVSNTVPFVVGDLPECLEQEPNDTPQAAQAVALPVIVNGRIERPGDWDVFRFAGRAGQQIVAEVTARRLESPLDSVLELIDAAGKRLAFNDDHADKTDGLRTHQADSLVLCTLPADGTYCVRLGDAQDLGGPDHAYRLRLSEPRPDFELRVVPSCIHAFNWQLNLMTVFAQRKDGFSGPIALAVKNTEGIFMPGGGVVPDGQDQVRVTLAVEANVSPEPIHLCLEGRAAIAGRELVREAVATDDTMQAFFYRHMVPARNLWLVPNDRASYRKPDDPKTAGGKSEPSHGPRRTYQGPWAILSEQPAKVPAGGTVEVRLRTPWGSDRGEIQLELSDPPEGIAIQKMSLTREALTVVLRGDATARPGLKGNLIALGFRKGSEVNKEGKKREFRYAVGPMPAIPFEIVNP